MIKLSMSDQFNELVKSTVSEEQELTEQANEKVEMIDQSAKSQDLFQSNMPTKRKYITTRIKSRSFYQILLMLVLIKRTCTIKILFSTFICY